VKDTVKYVKTNLS